MHNDADEGGGRSGPLPEELIAVALMVAGTVLAGIQVVRRSILGTTFVWAEEVVVTMIVWSVFFGASAVTYRRLHIRMDLVAASLAPRLRPLVEIAAGLVCLAYVAFVTYLSVFFVLFVRTSAETDPSLDIPRWILHVGMPVGLCFMLVRSVQDLAAHVRAALRPPSGTGARP